MLARKYHSVDSASWEPEHAHILIILMNMIVSWDVVDDYMCSEVASDK